jgi:hypothetical protein
MWPFSKKKKISFKELEAESRLKAQKEMEEWLEDQKQKKYFLRIHILNSDVSLVTEIFEPMAWIASNGRGFYGESFSESYLDAKSSKLIAEKNAEHFLQYGYTEKRKNGEAILYPPHMIEQIEIVRTWG